MGKNWISKSVKGVTNLMSLLLLFLYHSSRQLLWKQWPQSNGYYVPSISSKQIQHVRSCCTLILPSVDTPPLFNNLFKCLRSALRQLFAMISNNLYRKYILYNLLFNRKLIIPGFSVLTTAYWGVVYYPECPYAVPRGGNNSARRVMALSPQVAASPWGLHNVVFYN